VLAEGVGIDADAVGVALAAQDLRLLLRLGDDLDALPVGVGGDLLGEAVALGAELRRLALAIGAHAGIDRLAVLLRQIGAADAYIGDVEAQPLGLRVHRIADAAHGHFALARDDVGEVDGADDVAHIAAHDRREAG